MDTEEIAKLAALAKLQISKDTVEHTTASINQVLELVDQLKSVDTQQIEPMAHPLDAVQTLRKDHITEPNQREKYQGTAPLVEDGLYLVPRVID